MDVSGRLHAKADDCDRAADGLFVSHPDLSRREKLRGRVYRNFAGLVAGHEKDFLDRIKGLAAGMNLDLQSIEDDFESRREKAKRHDGKTLIEEELELGKKVALANCDYLRFICKELDEELRTAPTRERKTAIIEEE